MKIFKKSIFALTMAASICSTGTIFAQTTPTISSASLRIYDSIPTSTIDIAEDTDEFDIALSASSTQYSSHLYYPYIVSSNTGSLVTRIYNEGVDDMNLRVYLYDRTTNSVVDTQDVDISGKTVLTWDNLNPSHKYYFKIKNTGSTYTTGYVLVL